MKSLFICTLAIALPVMMHAGGATDFEDQETGAAPAGWTVEMTGKGSPHWTVENEPTAPSGSKVLKQSGTASYPLCVKNDTSLADGFVEVYFKPLTGEKDQAAGIVWRYGDSKNYYIVRANALEDNVVLYKVENGKRSSLNIVGREEGYGVDTEVPNGQWQVLRVEFAGDLFTVYLEGQELFQVKDQTFAGAGKAGLWTKADSVTLFDDFSSGAIDRMPDVGCSASGCSRLSAGVKGSHPAMSRVRWLSTLQWTTYSPGRSRNSFNGKQSSRSGWSPTPRRPRAPAC